MIRTLLSRLTGREAAALRYQRQTCDEEAGRVRQALRRAEEDMASLRRRHEKDLAILRGDLARRTDELRRARAWGEQAQCLVEALVAGVRSGDPEDALADAATWLQGRAPIKPDAGRVEGLLWMPGESKETK